MRIGIIYIAIGIYEDFWKEFYPTCECFFCVDAEKGYEVFTDSSKLQSMTFPRVTWHSKEDRGFIKNVLAKSEFICSIAPILKEKYDYIFYLNANYKFLEPIMSHEIIPNKENDFLTVLSYNIYKNRPIDQYTYDRNPNCKAYIPYGKGNRYYQSGFYGGRTKEMLKFSEWSLKHIIDDLSKKIIAKWHDESYLNKYLQDLSPRIVDNEYGNYSVPKSNNGKGCKAILIYKESYLGELFLKKKDVSIDNSLSFLMDDNLKVHPIGVVHLLGELGSQMFQYAFYLYLQNKIDYKRIIYLQKTNDEQITSVFKIVPSTFVSETLNTQIEQINQQQKYTIVEKQEASFQNIQNSTIALIEYYGSWKCFKYIEQNSEILKGVFKFDYSLLNSDSQLLLQSINSTCSVSVHVKRKNNSLEKDMYGIICTIEYYRQAIKKMKELLSKKLTFYIFTDDIEWVNKYFYWKNCVLIKTDSHENNWQYMALMAACQHHIIANNNSSWWSAWLGHNTFKKIITPEWWYYGIPTPDLLPASWIRIRTHIPKLEDTIISYLFLRNSSKIDSRSYIQKMADVLYLYHYKKKFRKKIATKVANDKLNFIFENITNVSSLDELIVVCKGILYLLNGKFIKGSSNFIFSEIDAYLKNIIYQQNNNSGDKLIKIASYFLARILELGDCKKKTNLIEVLIYVVDILYQSRAQLSIQHLNEIMLLLQLMNKLDVFKDYCISFYSYCFIFTKDLNTNKYLSLESSDLIRLFFLDGFKKSHLY